MIRYTICITAIAVCIAGCTPSTIAPEPSTAHVPAVERTRLPDVPTPPKVPSEVKGAPPVPAPPDIVVPPNTLYVCVIDKGGVRKQTAIEFAPKVDALCAKAALDAQNVVPTANLNVVSFAGRRLLSSTPPREGFHA